MYYLVGSALSLLILQNSASNSVTIIAGNATNCGFNASRIQLKNKAF